MMKTFPTRRFLVLGLLACLGAFAGSTLALWVSTRTVYSGVTLAAKSTRLDTVIVSEPAKNEKPQDQFVIAFAGTSQAATADSQYHAVIKAIRGGKTHQIGEDSLMLRPDPAVAGVQSGEVRLMHWVADSLQVTTRNPKSATVTGATLTVTAERVR